MDEVNLIDYYGSDRAVLARDISLDSTGAAASRIMLGALNHTRINWYATVQDSEGRKVRKYEDARLLWEAEADNVFQGERVYEYDDATFVFNVLSPLSVGSDIAILDASTGQRIGTATRSDARNACIAASIWSAPQNQTFFSPLQLDPWDVMRPTGTPSFLFTLSGFGNGIFAREDFIVSVHSDGSVSAARLFGILIDTSGIGTVISTEEHPYGETSHYWQPNNPSRRNVYRIGDILAIDSKWHPGSLDAEGVEELRYFDTNGTQLLAESAPHPTRSEFPGVMGTGNLPAPWPLGFDEDGNPYYLVGRSPNFEILNKDRVNVMPNWLDAIVNDPAGASARPIFITQGELDLGGDTLIVVEGGGNRVFTSSGELLYQINGSYQSDALAGLMPYSIDRLHSRPGAVNAELVVTQPTVNNRVMFLNLRRRAYYARMEISGPGVSAYRVHIPQYRATWSA